MQQLLEEIAKQSDSTEKSLNGKYLIQMKNEILNEVQIELRKACDNIVTYIHDLIVRHPSGNLKSIPEGDEESWNEGQGLEQESSIKEASAAGGDSNKEVGDLKMKMSKLEFDEKVNRMAMQQFNSIVNWLGGNMTGKMSQENLAKSDNSEVNPGKISEAKESTLSHVPTSSLKEAPHDHEVDGATKKAKAETEVTLQKFGDRWIIYAMILS